jgi:thioredoxin reductase (NADPH)
VDLHANCKSLKMPQSIKMCPMHDVIIIGAGPAGLSAAFWSDELGLDALLLEQNESIGGQLNKIFGKVENYPGLRARDGQDLLEQITKGIDDASFDLWTGAEIDSFNPEARKIHLKSGESLQAITILITTGVRRRSLGIEGEQEFLGRGVMESGVYELERYRGKDVCIVGGGDAAIENALILSEVCATVTVVNRGVRLRARREFSERIATSHNITLFNESKLTRIIGQDSVEAIEISRRESIKPFQMAVSGVLIRVGVEPNTELFRDRIALNSEGYIRVSQEQETSVENVFAAGDVCNPLAPTIITAMGEGAKAAKVIAHRLNSH